MKVPSKYLFVGDPHVTVDELSDCDKLVSQILDIATQQKVDRIVWLGDLHHNHSVVRLEVMDWWDKALGTTLKDFQHICLVGNHDRSTESRRPEHALLPLKRWSNVTVVDTPTQIEGVSYLPYIHDVAQFVASANASSAKSVVCHATFAGSYFANGFVPEGGIAPSDVNQTQIISGHIHCRQTHGKVFYPGSPRWRDANDANEAKFLFTANLGESQLFEDFEYFESQCSKIVKAAWSPDVQLKANDRAIFEVSGTQEEVDRAVVEIRSKHPKARIQTSVKRVEKASVSESAGIKQSLDSYLSAYPDQIKKLALGRVYGLS